MITGDPSRYYHYDDLTRYARDLISTIAQDHQIAGVAGVPRSGMLAAAAAAIHLGVPLFEANEAGIHSIAHGRRLDNLKQEGRIVVMEDSLNTGARFAHIRKALGPSHLYAAVFSTPRSIPRADYVHCKLELPHWFDWWLWGSKYLLNRNIGIDFDGILCGDCPREKDTDDEAYVDWMRNVRPIRHARPYGVPVVITGRLEKYREITQDWCQRNRQEVVAFRFGQWESAAQRTDIAGFKAKVCREMRLSGFIESDMRQAERIAQLARIPVACPDARKVYGQK